MGNFFSSNRFRSSSGYVFFKICSHIIRILKSNLSGDFLVAPKQEVERKSEWFCGVKLFRSKFKVVWENGVWTKIRFLATGFLLTCGIFTLIFTVFSICLNGFFLSGFPNPLIGHSRPSFFWTKLLFLAWFFHMLQFDLDFRFFLKIF